MHKLLRYGAVVVTGLSLSTGVVAAQSASTEGPNSPATVRVRNHDRTDVNTNNNVKFKNNNSQSASSGNAKARNNTTVGDVGSGDASAENGLNTSLTLDNSNAVSAGTAGIGHGDSWSADATTQGPNSPAKVTIDNKNSVKVTTNNNVNVTNNNSQHATSGNASASNNTTVGDVHSGDAHVTNDTTFELNITN